MPMRFLYLQLCLLCGFFLWSQASLAEDAFTELNAAYGPTAGSLQRPGNWHGLVGGTLLSIQTPMGERKTFVLPLVALSYRQTFYWHFGQAGVYVLKSNDRRARLAIAIKARRGYDPSDYSALTGMDKRYTSVEGGIHGIWLSHGLFISYGLFTDISGRSHGSSAQLSLARPFRLAPRWHLVPSISGEWLSADIVDYYYGVTASEATATRPAYTGSASSNLRLGLMLTYRLSRDWSLFGGAGVTRLGGGISDSPIVSRDSITALHLGAGWRF